MWIRSSILSLHGSSSLSLLHHKSLPWSADFVRYFRHDVFVASTYYSPTRNLLPRDSYNSFFHNSAWICIWSIWYQSKKKISLKESAPYPDILRKLFLCFFAVSTIFSMMGARFVGASGLMGLGSIVLDSTWNQGWPLDSFTSMNGLYWLVDFWMTRCNMW